MEYILGIDQGGTKTQAAVSDIEGHILGIGQSAGACHSINGMEAAMEMIHKAAAAALGSAGLQAKQISEIAAGLTGVDWSDEAGLLQDKLADLFQKQPEHVRVVNDCIIALRAATEKDKACILCAGTGLNCAVRKDRQNEYVFGYYIPDELQGGSALAEKVLQAVVDAESGVGRPTALTGRVLEELGLGNVEELLRHKVEGRISPGQRKELPLLLERAALAGDQVSLGILADFGEAISRYVTAGLQRFNMLDSEVDVILSGSVFKCRASVLQDAVAAQLHRHAPAARIVESFYEPVIGAVLLGLDSYYEELPKEIYWNIADAQSRYHIVRRKGGISDGSPL